MPTVRLRILGESVIEIGASRVTPSATHLFSLLLYLGLERDRTVSRAELAAMMFDDTEPSAASHNLRQLLYRVRRLGVPLLSEASSVALPQKDVNDGMADLLQKGFADRLEPRRLSYALLPHYSPPTASLSNWLERTRDRVNRVLVRGLATEIDSARRSANWRVVEALASATLELDPYNENATLLRAEALARTGSKHQAVALLHDFEREVGRSADSLTIQPRILKRRISESAVTTGPMTEVPLIGRSKEMSRLSDSWSSAQGNKSAVLVVSGEKSVGKSRIIAEFQSMVRLDNSGTLLSVRRLPHDRHRPMSLFADISKPLICMPGAAGCSPRSIPFLERLNEAPHVSQGFRSEDFDAEYSANGVRLAILDLFESVCAERPLVCHVDDAHHLDDASLDLLSSLCERLASSPLLMLLSGECGDMASSLGASSLHLKPLDPASIHALGIELAARSGMPIPSQGLERCVSFSGGNPGHLEQLILHVTRTGDYENVPADLLYLTDDRLSRVSSASLHVLQACVVFGTDCTTEAISALTGLERYDLLAALQELEDRSLILSSGADIRCRSALVEDRAIASLTGAVRSLLHRRAARFLEESNPSSSSSQALAWRIGAHWTQAGDSASALRWRRLSWRHLISIGRPMAAINSIRAQLEGTNRPVERAVLLDTLIEALQSAGSIDELHVALAERQALTLHVHDSRERQCALAFDAAEATLSDFGVNNAGIEEVRRHLHSNRLDATRRIRASRLLMIAADNAVDPVFADEVYDVVQGLRPTDEHGQLQRLHTRLIYHTVFGSRDEARNCATELAERARMGECSVPIMTSELNTSMARHVIDDSPPCFSQLEQRYEDCRNAGMDSIALRFAARIAVLLIDIGQLEEAFRWGKVSASLATGLRIQRLSGDYLTSQIDLALLSGRLTHARALVDQMLERAPAQSSSRLSMDGLVYTMRIDQAHELDVASHQLDKLLAWHVRARTYGRHDDKMEVLWVALTKRGDSEHASELLSEYLLCARRESREANYQLRMRTATDPAWGKFAIAPS